MSGYLLVANAEAGSAEQTAVDEARAVLAAAGAVETATCRDEGELDDIVRGAGDRTVVVAGGDGSLHAAVNALARQGLLERTRVGLVPLGTGNDFARGVGIPLEPDRAASLICSTSPTAVDLIRDSTGGVAVNNVHLGVGAAASRKGGTWKSRLGRVGYAVGALAAGLRPRFLRVRIEIDGVRVYAGHVAQVAIGNASRVGGGTELVPGADPADGRLTIVVSREMSVPARIGYLVRLRRGRHLQMREVSRLTGREATVTGEPFEVVTDGEITGPHTDLRWTVVPGALSLHLPG